MSDERIDVEQSDKKTFQVTVEGRTETNHTVTLEPDDRRRIAGENVTGEELVEASFEFLLDREPNTSILSRFDLLDIKTYFPEYEDEVGAYL